MSRTPEQQAADNALGEAISQVRDAYGLSEEGEVVTDYVVVGATVTLEDEDLFVLVRDSKLPPWKVRMLLKEGRRILREAEELEEWVRIEDALDEMEEGDDS